MFRLGLQEQKPASSWPAWRTSPPTPPQFASVPRRRCCCTRPRGGGGRRLSVGQPAAAVPWYWPNQILRYFHGNGVRERKHKRKRSVEIRLRNQQPSWTCSSIDGRSFCFWFIYFPGDLDIMFIRYVNRLHLRIKLLNNIFYIILII